MRAIEVTGTIDRQGNLLLDRPLGMDRSSRVRVIVLFSEPSEPQEEDPDDTPIAEIKASLKRGSRTFQDPYIPHIQKVFNTLKLFDQVH